MIMYPSPLSYTYQLYPSVVMYNSSVSERPYENFTESSNLACSLQGIFTYNQSHTELVNAYSSYLITLSGLQGENKVSLSTVFKKLQPNVNNGTEYICTESTCQLTMQNGCVLPLNTFNYFDIIQITLQTPSETLLFQYNVLCAGGSKKAQGYMGTTFQYGLLIEIVICTALVSFMAFYSRAWSINGRGITINIWIVLAFNAILIIGGLLGYFAEKYGYFRVITAVVNIISWVFGLSSVWLCANQNLFLIKGALAKYLHRAFSFKIWKQNVIQIRVMDIISVLVALLVCCGWFFSKKMWFLNDIVSFCIIIAAIKIFKFVSLRDATICFGITIGVQMVYVLIISLCFNKSYNNIIMNTFNSPFQLQMPTINAVYNQRCSWVPVTAIIYPGALMSYLRRFDSNQNAHIFVIAGAFMFLFGSLIWIALLFASPIPWPFGLFCETLTLASVAFLSWKRKAIKNLWKGSFYDEEFADQECLKTISESISHERRNTEIKYQDLLFENLKITDKSDLQNSQIVYQSKINEIVAKKLNFDEIEQTVQNKKDDKGKKENYEMQQISQNSQMSQKFSITSNDKSEIIVLKQKLLRGKSQLKFPEPFNKNSPEKF